MIAHIVITKDDGTPVSEMTANALIPNQRKMPYETPATEGAYSFYGFTYQPIVKLTGKAGGF